jgi:hypothetical protein
VYRQLKDILGIAPEQQVESSLQCWADVSILSPGYSKASRQRTTSELPAARTTSSPVWAQPISDWATRADAPSLRHTVRLAGGRMGHVPSIACITRAVMGMVIEKGIASAPKG